MYEELIKSLREAPSDWYDAELHYEAADAIEELSKPRWIPVTKWLPEEDKYVLVRYKNNDMAVACIFDMDEDITFWRAQTDEEWCADCDTQPTHWMPLPEPPKEEI